MTALGISIFLVSAAAVSYEILLIRLLSIIQWHHFISMIVSLALLGYAASGTLVARFYKRLISRFEWFFIGNSALFGPAMAGGFIVSQRIGFNPLEILWEPTQVLRLIGVYLTLFVPFFFAANCICAAFARFKAQIHRIYRFDLFGAGTGALWVLALLFLLPPEACLRILCALGPLAAGVFAFSLPAPRFRSAAIVLGLSALALPFLWPQSGLSPRVSEYKGLSLARRVPDTEILSERHSPLGWLAVVRSPTIPFRYAPGLSLNCALEPPPQLGIFTDGDAFSPITRYDGDPETIAYLDCLSSALPHHLLENPKALILGAGGGMDVLMALYHGAKAVDAVEVNPQMIDLLRREHAEFAGHIYEKDRIRVHVAEARGFAADSGEQFDLIQLSLLDSFSSAISASGALTASYLYTVEAFQDYYRRLSPGGILAVTRWLKVPPRDALKLFATAISACDRLGVQAPARQLCMIRSWLTSTMLLKRGAFTAREISKIETFCRARSFDVIHYPGIGEGEVNRYNVLDEPYFHQGVAALLSEKRDDFLERYKFNVSPATDDRPYFFHFFKWRSLREILALKGQGGLPLLEWGYPILVATLLQAIILSLIFVLLPLVLTGQKKLTIKQRGRLSIYFLALGLAFLFVEIAFIQKFILFLHHPVYAASAVLCAFLIFAGLGSGFSRRWSHSLKRLHPASLGAPIAAAVAAIGVLCVLYLFFLPPLFHLWIHLPSVWKFLISILLIAPLAFFMGMPFPLGLAQVAQATPDFIPWAWGLNGCASVLSAILATMLSIHVGFNVVVVSAVLLYILSAFAFWSPLLGERLKS